ncbi:hypothetical protein G9A89_003129 [Geosiphon pyriformis]|nr:hypothetical protein G9A89_003129 [Geosiphon pyriformis]
MSDLQTSSSPLGNGVETNKQLVVDQQAILQALSYLRTELAKVQNENNELSNERDSLLEQLQTLEKQNIARNQKDETLEELRAHQQHLEAEKALLVKKQENLCAQLEQAHEEKRLDSETYSQLELKLQQFENDNEKLSKERDFLVTQLEQTRGQKTHLEAQHQSLLAKLATVKTSLEDKLKGDMEELKQARQQIAGLNQQNQELNNSISQLKFDASTHRNENEKLVQELEHMRTQVFKIQQHSAHEIAERDTALKELQIKLERVEGERRDWEMTAMQEKGYKDEMSSHIKHLERDIEILRNEKEILNTEKETESESLSNLQTVLEEFQAAKESEIREAVEGIQRRLAIATSELSEFKERAILAESQLSQIKGEYSKTQQYEREIKEKNLLIGKLRHEAVILNEHLTEAMRRMREESSDHNVDKRLITNLLIAFFNTPRGDSKRFEILQLMSSMLQWTDEQKEQVGLIRRSAIPRSGLDDRPSGWVSGLWTPTSERPLIRKSEEVPRSNSLLLPVTEEAPRESFSDMWISFLLKEANKDNVNQVTTTSANQAASS